MDTAIAELAPVGHHELTPAELVGEAGNVASACKAIVASTAQAIQGKKYVRVEGWQAIAIAHGCVASSRDVERTDTGYRAIGEIRRRDTGAVIATAEGFVGDDEPTWSGRHEYARRAMAQTRAISRACRSAFAHVVVMMAAGLETTPAEEMPHDGDHHQPRTAELLPIPSQAGVGQPRAAVSGDVPPCPKCGNPSPMRSKFPKPGAVYYCNPKGRSKGCGNQWDDAEPSLPLARTTQTAPPDDDEIPDFGPPPDEEL